MANVLPIQQPNADDMRKHIEHLFWREWADGEFEGLIELAHTNASNGRLDSAELFPITEIDLLIEKAVEINSVPRQNVYIGAALRKPQTTKNSRSSDDDYFLSTCAYCDLDEGSATENAINKYNGIEPTMVVITGEQPNYRAHLYWKLKEPIREQSKHREIMSLVANNFDGDSKVTNPGRVLRLGGTIAWPDPNNKKKKDRPIELTKVVEFKDRKKPYTLEQLRAAYLKKFALPKLDLGFSNKPQAGMSLSELEAQLDVGNWDDTVVFMIHRLKDQGYDDAKILEYSTRWTLNKYTDQQTIREVRHKLPKIQAYREKHDIQPKVVEPILIDTINAADWKGVEPKEREWIVQDWIPAKHVIGFYGDGGVGKTLLMQQLLTACATGEKWCGLDVHPCKAYGFFCEDYENDILLTQKAINLDLGITMNSLEDLNFSSRVGENNILMKFDGKDVGELTDLYYSLVEEIKKCGAELVIIDTLADTFGGGENVRTQARQFVSNCLGRMAREINGTVIVCAHPSIAGMQSGSGYGGSTAWSNTYRSRLYLSRPDPEDRDDEVDPDQRILERKKSNYSSTGEPIDLRWESGVLIPETKSPSTHGELQITMEQARQVLAEIDSKWTDGKPYARANNTGARWVVRMMMSKFKIRKKVAIGLAHSWWSEGVIDDDIVNKKTHLKGLKVTRWL